MKFRTSRQFLARLARRRTSRSLAVAASLPLFLCNAKAGTENDLLSPSSGGSLVNPANWSLMTLPTITNDAVLLPNVGSTAGNRGITATNLTVGSFNSLSPIANVTVQTNTSGATNSTLTLGGTNNLGNSITGNAADLIYVASGGTLNFTNVNGGSTPGTGTLFLALGQNGNFNIAGTSTISSVIGDGGNGYALTKTGAGTLTLSAANTFSGGLVLNAGTVSIAAVNNLGSGPVSFGGGTLAITAAVDPSVQFSQAANQAYNISNAVAVTFATALTSSNGTFTKSGAGVLTSTAANTFSGTTAINGGSLALSGAGALASGTVSLQGGGLTLTNTGAGNNAANRIADTANVQMGGGVFLVGGSDQTNTNVAETIGTLTSTNSVNGANSVLTVAPGTTGGSTVLTAGSFSRAAGANGLLVNGVGLGSSTTSTSQLQLTTAPTLVGTTAPLATGINAGAQNTQIVPGLVGEATSTTGGLGTATGTATSLFAANTFMTYTATGGLRPLNPTDEFTQNAITTGNNIRITAATSSAGGTINSLVLNGSTAAASTLTLTGTLNVTSGMVLFAPTTNVAASIAGGTLAFGATEGQIYVNSLATTGQVAQTITSAVTGSNGLTLEGNGNNLTISGAVTLSGGTLSVPGRFLTLSGSNNLTGASVSMTGNGGILFEGSYNAINGASGLAISNGGSVRYTATVAAYNTPTAYASVPMTLGSGTSTGNLFFQSPGNNNSYILPGAITLNSTVLNQVTSYNAGNNFVSLTGGVSSAANVTTGGIEYLVDGSATTQYHLIAIGGTQNYSGITQIASGAVSGRVALNNTTLPTSTVLSFRSTTASRVVQFDLNGQSQTVSGLQQITATGINQIVNGSTTAGSLTVNNSANYSFAGNLGTVGNTIGAVGALPTGQTITAGTILYAPTTANNFSLTKTGTGTLTLTGAGSYTGGTTINGGRLQVFNGAALGTGGVTIGTGTNAGALTTAPGAITLPNLITTSGTGSVLSPGSTITASNGAVGMLTLSGGLNLASGATIPFDLAATSATSDLITVSAGTFTSATGTGSGSITFAFNPLVTVAGGTTYALINYSAATASDVDLGDFTATGVAGSFQFNAANNELDFVVAVPEPATVLGGMLLVAAFGWHLGFRRRRTA